MAKDLVLNHARKMRMIAWKVLRTYRGKGQTACVNELVTGSNVEWIHFLKEQVIPVHGAEDRSQVRKMLFTPRHRIE